MMGVWGGGGRIWKDVENGGWGEKCNFVNTV